MEFQNPNNERLYREQIAAIEALVNGAVDAQAYAWDRTAQTCATRIEQVKALLDDKILGEDRDEEIQKLSNELSTFLDRCASP